MPPEYVVAYDILDEGFGFGRLVPLLGWLAGLAILVTLLVRERPRGGGRMMFFVFALMFWTCVGGCGVGNVLTQHIRCLNWAKNGDFEVAEGEVRDFKPMPEHGHAQESFTVSGVRFSYSDFDLSSGGFNNASSRGGPIRDRLYVRISHHDGRILKLEVRK